MTGDALERQRAFLLALLFGAFAALALIAQLPEGLFSRDLARGKPWRTSSTQVACAPRLRSCGGSTTDIFFHTGEDEMPWLEIDLGEPRQISSLRIRNRRDCCPERAVPLSVELGESPETFREVAGAAVDLKGPAAAPKSMDRPCPFRLRLSSGIPA